MIEFIKAYYVEIAAVIVAIWLFTKVRRAAKRMIGLIFSIATIARLVMMFYHN
jgi:hypothetical protein